MIKSLQIGDFKAWKDESMNNVKSIPIKDIIPYNNNPRVSDGAIEYVANSIKEFGFKVPIILDKDSVIIAGHTRLKAAKKLGMKEVPCIIADDLSPEQVKAYRIADNSTGELSQWDWRKLDKELEELDTLNMEDFGLQEIEDIFSAMDKSAFDAKPKESVIFSVTFNFPKEDEKDIKKYIKKNGKDEIVEMIIKKCKGEDDGTSD